MNTSPRDSVGCTCGPYMSVIPPPPCPVHAPQAVYVMAPACPCHRWDYTPHWATTTTTTTFQLSTNNPYA